MVKDTIIQNIQQDTDPILGAILQHEKEHESDNRFPIEVFPEFLQHYINECTDKLNHTPDYLGGSILSAASTLIGTSIKLKVKDSWNEKCNLFLAIVGKPGDGKSHSLALPFKPIEKREKEYYAEYKNKLKEYKEEQKNSDTANTIQKPFIRKRIIQDFTIEALMLVHSYNELGITIKVDEAMGFFNNMGRYNSSGELQQYLSLWSGDSVSVDRKTSESIRIDDTFVGFIGSIQSAILHRLTKDDKGSNGFLERILWVFPDNPKKQYWGAEDINPKIQRSYDSLCSVIAELSETVEDPILLILNNDAWEYLQQWQNYNTDQQDGISDMEVSINKKLEQYVLRFCIILETLEAATKGRTPKTVSVQTIKNSILLYNYFQINALKVRDTIDKLVSPLESLTDVNKRLYAAFSKAATKKHITTNNAINTARVFYLDHGESDLKEETVKKRVQRFIHSNKQLFKMIKQGVYECLVDTED